MIITISGNPGSGKSTVAKKIVNQLGYERIYAGGMMREMARERGITLEELMTQAKTDTKIDQEVDERVATEARKYDSDGKNVLVEGRVQYHFLPESTKIYVWVEPRTGAERIWKDLQDQETATRRNQVMASSVDEVLKNSADREAGDAQRYLKLYNTDHRLKENYDFVVDTTNITAVEATEKVLKYIATLKKDN